MKCFVVIFLVLQLYYNKAQTLSVDTVGLNSTSQNIYSKAAFSDSLASSFCIVIKKEVKPHKHITHSEHVFVVEGEGTMKMGDKIFSLKKNDLVFIPKNTIHSVKSTGKTPLKVISIQSPMFDGSDRIMTEEK
jgi:mannose-6-phosphate isomerase-like protein (cupin superfamily)